MGLLTDAEPARRARPKLPSDRRIPGPEDNSHHPRPPATPGGGASPPCSTTSSSSSIIVAYSSSNPLSSPKMSTPLHTLGLQYIYVGQRPIPMVGFGYLRQPCSGGGPLPRTPAGSRQRRTCHTCTSRTCTRRRRYGAGGRPSAESPDASAPAPSSVVIRPGPRAGCSCRTPWSRRNPPRGALPSRVFRPASANRSRMPNGLTFRSCSACVSSGPSEPRKAQNR